MINSYMRGVHIAAGRPRDVMGYFRTYRKDLFEGEKMKNKDLEQFMCDYFTPSEEIAVNARWLQSQLVEMSNYKNIIKSLQNKNDILQSMSIGRDYGCPEYRLNVKV